MNVMQNKKAAPGPRRRQSKASNIEFQFHS